jgi:hypothetical protein
LIYVNSDLGWVSYNIRIVFTLPVVEVILMSLVSPVNDAERAEIELMTL